MVTPQQRPASICRCSTRPPVRIDGPTICWRAGRDRSDLKRRGVEMRLIIDGDATTAARVDLPLLDATTRAYRWSNDLLAGRARSIGEVARREHPTAPPLGPPGRPTPF